MCFEAVVLPFSYDNTTERAKIKKLELAIQMGVEERQDYDPVDLAVDIYQTTSGNDPIMTQADYAADSHMPLMVNCLSLNILTIICKKLRIL